MKSSKDIISDVISNMVSLDNNYMFTKTHREDEIRRIVFELKGDNALDPVESL